MTAILRIVTLTFTVPALCAAPSVGVRSDVREAVVYQHRQSATWVAMRPAMEALGDVWAATWPRVAWEARPIVLARVPLSWPDAGRRMSVQVSTSDSLAFFYVTVRDAGGRESAKSNEVGK